MTRHTTTTKARASVTRPPVDADTILSKSRRILWGMKIDGKAMDPAAAAAVGPGRHGEAGRRWAKGIMEAVKTGEDVEAAIVRALLAAVV